MYIWFRIFCFIISRCSLLFKSFLIDFLIHVACFSRASLIDFLNFPNYIMNFCYNAFYFFQFAESIIILLQFMQEIARKVRLTILCMRTLQEFWCGITSIWLKFYAVLNSNMHPVDYLERCDRNSHQKAHSAMFTSHMLTKSHP